MDPEKLKKEYDIFILGSGIAGSSTALALAQEGLKVLVVEIRSHPRFAIGESTTPVSTVHFKYIGERYHIPEIVDLCKYSLTETTKNKLNCDFPKCHFWFGWHDQGKKLKVNDEFMIETLYPPIGPDVHFRREIVDEFLVSLFPKYGVDYVDNTVLKSFELKESGYDIELFHREEKANSTLKAKYIVDATGHSTFFGKKLGLRMEEPKLRTNTSYIYNHFKLSDLPSLDDVLGGPSDVFRYKRQYGTMHHCFEGGWIWVIPFDYDYVSVGIIVDRNKMQVDLSKSPEEDFYRIIRQFPTINEHIGHLEPEGEFVRKEREQIQSYGIIGDRLILTPHASSFIDALFSTGIEQTMNFARNFIPIIVKAVKDDCFDKERFQPIETLFFRDIEGADTLVSGAIESFRHPEVMKQYLRVWVNMILTHIVYIFFLRGDEIDMKYSANYGDDKEEFKKILKKVWSLVFESREMDQLEVARQICDIIDPHMAMVENIIDGKRTTQACSGYPLLYKAGEFKDKLKAVLDYEKANIPEERFEEITKEFLSCIKEWTSYKGVDEKSKDERRCKIYEGAKLYPFDGWEPLKTDL